MSDKKNIDRLFQENLKNFEVTPNDAVWENIHKTLHKDKRKRRVLIPLWWRVAGVAALLVLMFAIANSLLNETDNNTDLPVVNSNASTNDNLDKNTTRETESQNLKNASDSNTDFDIVEPSANSEEFVQNPIKNSNVDKSSEKRNTHVVVNNAIINKENLASPTSDSDTSIAQKSNNTTAKTIEYTVAKKSSNLPELNPNAIQKNELKPDLLNKETLADPENAIAKQTETNPLNENETILEHDNLAETDASSSIEDAIALAENTNEKEKEEQLNRWNISPSVAPVYFNTLGEGSSIHEQFVGNSKNGELNMSYGLGGSYAINKKLKIRAGIHKVNLGYSTNNVIAYSGIGARNQDDSNIKYNNNTKAMTFISAESINLASAPEILNTNIKGSLEQQIGFIEVPLEVEYNLIDKKIGVNVIGGFSTLFLSKNEIYSNLEGERALIGEATNINSTSYSANLGVGVNYNVSEKIKINLEPMFKYQVNTFNNSSGDFQPYFIGVYTGLSYKF